VIRDALLIVLGAGFLRAAARWPALLAAVLARLEHQRRRLATQSLIVHLPQAKHRLLLTLWHLATRWGYVTPAGVLVNLRLTHDLLGQLIAARRPTVSLAIKELDREGSIRRLESGAWLVTRRGQEAITQISGLRHVRRAEGSNGVHAGRTGSGAGDGDGDGAHVPPRGADL
jgi:CRP-like cAMP-binding protein